MSDEIDLTMDDYAAFEAKLHADIDTLNKLLDQSPDIRRLETMLARLLFLTQGNQVTFPTVGGELVLNGLTRIIADGYAVLACLRRGLYLPNFLHLRSAQEALASFNYVFGGTDAERNLRWERYCQYPKLKGYLDWKAAVDKGGNVHLHLQKFANPPQEVLGAWAKLFGEPVGKLKQKVRSWHHPMTMNQMCSALLPDPLGIFGLLSKASHFSRFQTSVTKGKHIAIGFPDSDPSYARKIANGMCAAVIQFLLLLDKETGQRILPAVFPGGLPKIAESESDR
jgi:hypothetical protein